MKISKAIPLIKKAIYEIDIYKQINSDPLFVTLSTLKQMRYELEEMLRRIELDDLPPKDQRSAGMGHVIVDSWPLDSKLGDIIIAAEQAYCDL